MADPLILLIDHRLAFIALAALIVSAAIPLAFAWARVIPEEAAPFDISRRSNAPAQEQVRDGTHPSKQGFVAIPLLIFVTVSYGIQFPGVPRDLGLRWLKSLAPDIEPAWILWGVESLFVLLNAGVVCYAIFGARNPLRVPLGIGAGLVLTLWLLAHFLRHSLLTP